MAAWTENPRARGSAFEFRRRHSASLVSTSKRMATNTPRWCRLDRHSGKTRANHRPSAEIAQAPRGSIRADRGPQEGRSAADADHLAEVVDGVRGGIRRDLRHHAAPGRGATLCHSKAGGCKVQRGERPRQSPYKLQRLHLRLIIAIISGLIIVWGCSSESARPSSLPAPR